MANGAMFATKQQLDDGWFFIQLLASCDMQMV
jgi:hypothetical protein